MCGRFAFYSPHESVVRIFGLDADAPDVEPHYNIAPTQYVAAVLGDEAGRRRLAMLYWGLVPWWARDKSIGARMINARAETLQEKPAFREAYRERRCLVLADGYYEWQQRPDGKQPHFIQRRDGEPFAMAGLWERWRPDRDAEPLYSCTIVTTYPAAAIASLHDRMPAILSPSDHAAWLDPRNQDVGELALLLHPFEGELLSRPVSKRVNSARNEGPELIEPVAPADAVDETQAFRLEILDPKGDA
jgi:putative SOS response-associated peptidase YedK